MNEALLNYISRRIPVAADAFQVYQNLTSRFPQFNPTSKIRLTDNPVVVFAEKPEFLSVAALPKPAWMPTPGLIAFFQRIRGRIHKWFVDNSLHHPGERSRGWQTYRFTIGMRQVYPEPPFVPVSRREIRLETYAWAMPEPFLGYTSPSMYPPKHSYFYITCAYDGATDTLYIRS